MYQITATAEQNYPPHDISNFQIFFKILKILQKFFKGNLQQARSF